MESRRLLTEAFLGEATLEVPDGEIEALKRVFRGAVKRRVLPVDAMGWLRPVAQNRRAADRVAQGTTPPPPTPAPSSAAPSTGVTNQRTGRTVPASNRFVQQQQQSEPEDGTPDDAPDSHRQGRRGDREDFPEFDAPRPASFDTTDLGGDDRVLSWNFLDRDGPGIDVPEPGGGRGMRTLKGAGQEPRPRGSIRNLFRRRPPDGRRELDRALRSADRDARRRERPQGLLGRLVRGKDVTR